LDVTLRVSAAEPTALRLHTFYFPTWHATLNGRPVETRDSAGLGLLTVDVPAGEHVIHASYGRTPLRWGALIASGVGAAIALAVAVGWRISAVATVAGMVALLGLSAGLRAWDDAQWAPIPARAPQSGDIGFAGGRARPTRDHVEVELVWLSRVEGPPDRRVGARLVDERGATLAEKWSIPRFGAAPTSTWHRNEIVRDHILLRLPPGAAATTVHVEAALEPGQWTRAERPIVAPANLTGAATPRAERPTDFGGQLRLLSASVLALGSVGARAQPPPGAHAIMPNDTLRVTLWWEPLVDLDTGYTVFVHLIGPGGRRYAQQDNQPGGGFAPTILWQRGVPVEDSYTLRVPPEAPPGAYRVDIGVYQLADLQRLTFDPSGASALTVARLKLAGPSIAPNRDAPVFGAKIALDDARIEADALILTWRAVNPISDNLTVFVHWLDSDGRLIAQQDGPPLNGDYPTDLWSVGETVLERRPGPPEAASQVHVGLYDVRTGQRQALADGSDFVRVRR
ncbi:MAG: hypothetical protein NZ518_08245, partial [Dehalococcoidia bacterium]|nr:hypothetical protein [Dehalococcoidia bacterium]